MDQCDSAVQVLIVDVGYKLITSLHLKTLANVHPSAIVPYPTLLVLSSFHENFAFAQLASSVRANRSNCKS